MIHLTNQTKDEAAQKLSRLNLDNLEVLSTYAGFAKDSDYAGMPRITGSLFLSKADTLEIVSVSKRLYGFLKDHIKSPARIPFDVIRYDAFYDFENKETKIIEINTKSVGMHEIVETLDAAVAAALDETQPQSFNTLMARTQLSLLADITDDNKDYLYLSRPHIPRWSYYHRLKELSPNFADCSMPEKITITDSGLKYEGCIYKNVIRKVFPFSRLMQQLVDEGTIAVAQPQWMRRVGEKDYLNKITVPEVLKTITFEIENIEQYRANKDSFVCKIANDSGSRSVFVGPLCSDEKWDQALELASKDPHNWVIQDFSKAYKAPFVIHGSNEEQLVSYPMQLGVFIVPDIEDTNNCTVEIVAKAYVGDENTVIFDPAGYDQGIVFANVVSY